jgi:hypothetical protein
MQSMLEKIDRLQQQQQTILSHLPSTSSSQNASTPHPSSSTPPSSYLKEIYSEQKSTPLSTPATRPDDKQSESDFFLVSPDTIIHFIDIMNKAGDRHLTLRSSFNNHLALDVTLIFQQSSSRDTQRISETPYTLSLTTTFYIQTTASSNFNQK